MDNRFAKYVAPSFLLGLALLLNACASSAINIPLELSPAELVQRAQEASDHNRYGTALRYYEALLDRNQDNISLICTGEYEVAFIHYKQKKYAQSTDEFNVLLERYDTPDEELLPPQYKRLAYIVLGNIAEKQKPHGILKFFQLFQKKAPPEKA